MDEQLFEELNLIEVEPLNTDEFLKVKETLTRIGIVSRKNEEERPTLWQSVHVLHKRGRYFILSFKQLFLLDGKTKETNFTQEDKDRVIIVANMLQSWGLVTLLKDHKPTDENVRVVVIPYSKKEEWQLRSKYSIGQRYK